MSPRYPPMLILNGAIMQWLIKRINYSCRSACSSETRHVVGGSGGENATSDVARFGRDESAVWPAGPANLVGVLVGYHGARHLLRRLRHHDGHVRLLRRHQTGEAGLSLFHFLPTFSDFWLSLHILGILFDYPQRRLSVPDYSSKWGNRGVREKITTKYNC